MTFYLCLQHTYDSVEIALFNDTQQLAFLQEDKKASSKNLIPRIEEILAIASLSLEDLAFIAVNQGPGPFTTLRTVITTANGLAFARSIPLIGINGLKALCLESPTHEADSVVVALLNAFSNDVYYAITAQGKTEISYAPIDSLVTTLNTTYQGSTVTFLGNGASLHKACIKKYCTDINYTIIPIDTNSIQSIASLALHKWRNSKHKLYELQPLYLKMIT